MDAALATLGGMFSLPALEASLLLIFPGARKLDRWQPTEACGALGFFSSYPPFECF